MFLTRLRTTVTGHTAREAVMKYAPDGTAISEVTLAVGDGSDRYPTMWVVVPVWAELAEEALKVIDKKGMRVEASGMLQVRQYEGKRGRSLYIVLKDVRELKIYDRDGELKQVLTGLKVAES